MIACTSHHFACDCRETKLRVMAILLKTIAYPEYAYASPENIRKIIRENFTEEELVELEKDYTE